jgi:hypothetical protein
MSEPRVPYLSVLSALDDAEMDFEQEPVRSELEERALVMRRQGVSFPVIAREQGSSVSTAFRRVRRASMREEHETSEERRATAAAQLDEVIFRMRSIMLSKDATHGAVIRAAEQAISAIHRKARLLGDDAPAKRVVVLHQVSDEALQADRERLEAELTAMGVDLSAFPTPEEIAQRLLASRRPVTVPERSNVGPVIGSR